MKTTGGLSDCESESSRFDPLPISRHEWVQKVRKGPDVSPEIKRPNSKLEWRISLEESQYLLVLVVYRTA